ncbi:MAG TPA: nuclear transport factor 2 family protein [Pseudolabrys sp.]|jgi:ketosteroid isomerase-like protein|nr:nuclear transport factor 2 family protein [Pseudolabrys sp.]
MPNPVPRAVVDEFFRVFATREGEKIAPFLDDNVTWTISGPVDLLHYCGTRVGKRAVIDVIDRQVPAVFHIRGFIPDMVLVDGDMVASLSRLSAVSQKDGRAISYRVAQFIRFANEKVVEFMSVIDSFNAVEQVLGHSIDLAESQPEDEGNLIAV